MLNQVLKAVDYRVLLSRPYPNSSVRTFRLADKDEIMFATAHAQGENLVAIEFEDKMQGLWYVWATQGYETFLTTKDNVVLEVMEDILEKLSAIAKHEPYDPRILISVDMSPEELEKITYAAMHAGMSVEDFIIKAVEEKIKKESL